MAKKFRTLNEYFNYIEKQLKICMKEIANKYRLEMADYVFTNLYKKRTPEEYLRTFQTLDAITYDMSIKNGKIQAKIFIDSNKIDPIYEGDSFWNQHMSISQKDVSDIIPEWINYGNDKPNSAFKYKGIDYIDYMVKYANQHLLTDLAILMKLRGINIK